VKALSKFRACGELKVNSTGKLLYLVLEEIADSGGEVVIPQKQIGGAIGISKGAVGRNLRKLKDGGYIRITAQYHSDGGRTANKYTIK
jgi:DNA-binding MarR family transcriptional regulator